MGQRYATGRWVIGCFLLCRRSAASRAGRVKPALLFYGRTTFSRAATERLLRGSRMGTARLLRCGDKSGCEVCLKAVSWQYKQPVGERRSLKEEEGGVSGNYKHLVLVSGCGFKKKGKKKEGFLEILPLLIHVRSHLSKIWSVWCAHAEEQRYNYLHKSWCHNADDCLLLFLFSSHPPLSSHCNTPTKTSKEYKAHFLKH